MNRVQTRIIKDALDEQDKLDEFEASFINDMAEKPEGYQCSEKQNKFLNRINEKLICGYQ